jgi:hypothetical protein
MTEAFFILAVMLIAFVLPAFIAYWLHEYIEKKRSRHD